MHYYVHELYCCRRLIRIAGVFNNSSFQVLPTQDQILLTSSITYQKGFALFPRGMIYYMPANVQYNVYKAALTNLDIVEQNSVVLKYL